MAKADFLLLHLVGTLLILLAVWVTLWSIWREDTVAGLSSIRWAVLWLSMGLLVWEVARQGLG